MSATATTPRIRVTLGPEPCLEIETDGITDNLTVQGLVWQAMLRRYEAPERAFAAAPSNGHSTVKRFIFAPWAAGVMTEVAREVRAGLAGSDQRSAEPVAVASAQMASTAEPVPVIGESAASAPLSPVSPSEAQVPLIGDAPAGAVPVIGEPAAPVIPAPAPAVSVAPVAPAADPPVIPAATPVVPVAPQAPLPGVSAAEVQAQLGELRARADVLETLTAERDSLLAQVAALTAIAREREQLMARIAELEAGAGEVELLRARVSELEADRREAQWVQERLARLDDARLLAIATIRASADDLEASGA